MALRASASAAPAVRPADLRGAPAELKGETSVANCKLRAAPERKPVSNDFNAALILPGGINIEISKPDVEGNGGSGLSADAGSSALEGPAPGAKDA